MRGLPLGHLRPLSREEGQHSKAVLGGGERGFPISMPESPGVTEGVIPGHRASPVDSLCHGVWPVGLAGSARPRYIAEGRPTKGAEAGGKSSAEGRSSWACTKGLLGTRPLEPEVTPMHPPDPHCMLLSKGLEVAQRLLVHSGTCKRVDHSNDSHPRSPDS